MHTSKVRPSVAPSSKSLESVRRLGLLFILCASSAGADDIVWPPTAAELGLMQGSPAAPQNRVTLANWQYAPYNRWAFQHVRQILPTMPVSRGTGPVRVLARDERPLSDVAFVHGARRLSVERMLAETYTDGFLVLSGGKIAAERYFNGLEPKEPHLLWSVSKSVLGALAGILVEDGRLDLEKTVADYVPELAESGWGDNAIRAVLDMQTTSDWIEDYDDPNSSVRRQDASNGLLPLPEEFAGLPRGNYRFLPTIGRNDARRGVFVYKSGDTDVAGWVMERATGTRLAELVSAELWSGLGVEQDGYYTVDPSGSVLASGGLNATLRDMARFGQLVLDRGRLGGEQLVPAAWIDDIRQNLNDDAWRSGAYDARPRGGYRSYWWHTANDHGAFYARGVHGQWVYVDPAARVVIVKLSSHPDPSSSEELAMTLAAFDAIARAAAELP